MNERKTLEKLIELSKKFDALYEDDSVGFISVMRSGIHLRNDALVRLFYGRVAAITRIGEDGLPYPLEASVMFEDISFYCIGDAESFTAAGIDPNTGMIGEG